MMFTIALTSRFWTVGFSHYSLYSNVIVIKAFSSLKEALHEE